MHTHLNQMAMKTNKIDSKISQALIKSDNQFPVVGVGASAGGLDAFKRLIKAIPDNSGIAYVLVQHLDPTHESMLPEILQKSTSIPVIEISDEIKIQPNHIYIIPSNKMLIANDGILELSPRTSKKNERNLPIDVFFNSLAIIHQSHAIGVVLSGTATDGTQGLKSIKDHGGLTFAQDEESAAYPGMPTSAIQAGVVDFILPPENIPSKLGEIINNIALSDEELQNLPKQDEDVFKQILAVMRIRKGTDFTYYKQTTIRRRILRRMALNKNEEVAYLKFLRDNRAEQDLLYQDLLIPVTSFFRDPKTFENLCKSIFPLILKNKTAGEPIRLWVAGCSTGQEAYSMAICLKELLGNGTEGRVQLFATDISEPAISKARTGIYTASEIEGINPQRMQDHFTKSNGHFQINKQIRDMCVFATHNFLKDPPFGKVDLISCRNVLIYMEPYLQKKALTTFHYALNPRGYLLLGKSETSSGVPDLFSSALKNDKLLIRKDAPGKFVHIASQRSEQSIVETNFNPKKDIMRPDFQKTADDIMLSKYTPAGVVVNEDMDIVHFRGKTINYLEQSPGKPSHNLLKMAKNGLAFELRSILHKAKKGQTSVVKENIPIQVAGAQRMVSIEAMPLPDTIEPHYLVLFHDQASNLYQPSSKTQAAKSVTSIEDDKDLSIQQLEKELERAREDMRAITEDQEAINEELQSANEELLSGSEELQSLNEELETSKEELQSTNEELTVVNQEMIGLNEQVTESRNFAEAIIANIRTPLLVLDKYLRIKSSNRAFFKVFHLMESEIEGKLIYDIGNREWNIPALRILLEQILPEQITITDYEVRNSFQSIGERIMLLNAQEIKTTHSTEKFILLAIEDITIKRTSDDRIKESENRYRNLIAGLPFPIFSCDKQGYIQIFNDAVVELFGQEPHAGKDSWCGPWKKLNRDGQPIPEERRSLIEVISDSTSGPGEEIIVERPDGSRSNVIPYIQATYGDNGEISGSINTFLNITEIRETQQVLNENEKRFRNIVLQIPIGITILRGPELKVELANETLLQIIGKKESDFVGKNLFDSTPENRDLVESELLKVLKTGKPYFANEFEFTINRHGKTEKVYLNLSFQPLRDTNGDLNGVVCLTNEITDIVIARKKMEAQANMFQKLLLSAPAFICTMRGPDHVYELVNSRYQQLFGKRKIQGKPLLVAVPELEGQGFDKILDQVYNTGETYVGIEIPILLAREKNSEPELRYLNFTYQPMYDENNHIYSILVFGYEVTEEVNAKNLNNETHLMRSKDLEEKVEQRTFDLNKANDSLLQKNMELEKMNDEMEAFSYVASHDLQEPLRKIQTFANRILEHEHDQLSEKAKDYFTRMQAAANRMQILIEDLLNYSQTGNEERKTENTILKKIIDEVQNELKETIKEKNAIIDCKHLGTAWVSHSPFRQLMTNLIGNSLKFTRPDVHPHITISSVIAKGSTFKHPDLLPKKDYCHIQVIDNGIGFEPQYEEQIFKVFQRLHGKSEYHGTGIGLAIVKKIVENHNGVITASGIKNKGATFDMYFPQEPIS